jgi:hypothetical protein
MWEERLPGVGVLRAAWWMGAEVMEVNKKVPNTLVLRKDSVLHG